MLYDIVVKNDYANLKNRPGQALSTLFSDGPCCGGVKKSMISAKSRGEVRYNCRILYTPHQTLILTKILRQTTLCVERFTWI